MIKHYSEFTSYKPKYERDEYGKKRRYKKKYILNDIFSFDIETTSYFIIDGKLTAWDEKYDNDTYLKSECGGVCYIWQFSINEQVYYGRELSELSIFLDRIFGSIDFENVNKPIIWVHNLSFEFQWIREIFDFTNVFARTQRKPIKAETDKYQFRCTYFLTQLSLAKWSESTPVRKQEGLLNYNVLRTPISPLTSEEMKYCEFDCLVVYYGIRDFQRKYKDQYHIPLTQTGEVRKVMRDMYHKDYAYLKKMASLVPDADLFYFMRAAFAGGSTGGNVAYTAKIIYNLLTHDLKSDYPAQLVRRKYPLTPFVPVYRIKRFTDMDYDRKGYILQVCFKNMKRKTTIGYLSKSHLYGIVRGSFDNGKLIQCEECTYIGTSIDIQIIDMVYDYEDYEIQKCYMSYLGYLDSKFVDFVLTLFYNKTCLDGVDDELYMNSKKFINALYGMQCTSPISNDITYENSVWGEHVLSKDEINEKFAKMKNGMANITAYQVGLFCPAWARLELYSVLMEDPEDICYWDTDSCKHYDTPKMRSIIEERNRINKELMDQAMEFHGFDKERTRPKNQKGKICQLGCWEPEKPYAECKFLGAKRYCYRYEGEECYHITVAGVPKNNSIFIKSLDMFDDKLVFPANLKNEKGEYIAKNMHQYKDGDNPSVVFPDGYVNTNINATVLRPTSYDMSLANDYRALVQFFKEGGSV